MIIYRLALVLLFSCVGQGLLRSGETNEVSLLVASLEKQIKQITSLSCRVELAFDKKEPFAFLDWAETASSFRYEYTEYDDSGKQVYWGLESSGLTNSMEFLSPQGQLVIRAHPAPYRELIKNFLLPTDLWEFAFNRWPSGAWKVTNTKLLQSPELFKDLASRVKFVGNERFNDLDCLVFDIQEGKARFEDAEVRYRVYIDPRRNYLPLGWKTFSDSGALLSEYQVIKFAKSEANEGIKQTIPEEVKIIFYKTPDGNSESIVNVSLVYRYKDIVMNEFRSDEEITLDPSIAETIHDQKEDILIPVPK